MAEIGLDYYNNQAGTGIGSFQGIQYQRGHGFFSSLLNFIKPLGTYFGKTLLSTGVNMGKDILDGENFNESLKKNIKTTAKKVMNDGIERAQKFAQTGSGKRRRRRKNKDPQKHTSKNKRKSNKNSSKGKSNSVKKKISPKPVKSKRKQQKSTSVRKKSPRKKVSKKLKKSEIESLFKKFR